MEVFDGKRENILLDYDNCAPQNCPMSYTKCNKIIYKGYKLTHKIDGKISVGNK
jgi:hypothetical protein